MLTFPEDERPHQVTIRFDLIPGPPVDGLTARILQIVIKELNELGAEVTRLNIELEGWVTSW